MKKLLFLSLGFVVTIFSADTIKVSESCAKDLQTINKDSTQLYYFLAGTFKGIAKKDSHYKPSHLIKYFASPEVGLDKTLPLEYMSATQYLNQFVEPYLNQLDATFDKYYQETKDIKKAWELFAEYFQKEGLKKPLEQYAQQLIHDDQERIEWAKKGVFFSDDGKTAIIDAGKIKQ